MPRKKFTRGSRSCLFRKLDALAMLRVIFVPVRKLFLDSMAHLDPAPSQRIGDQTAGCVFLSLYRDALYRDVKAMRAKGVKFREVPRKETYGTVAVFEDLYGNRWDLLQPSR